MNAASSDREPKIFNLASGSSPKTPLKNVKPFCGDKSKISRINFQRWRKNFLLKLLYVEIPLLSENPRSAWPYCCSGQLWSGSDLKVQIQILNKKLNKLNFSFFLKLVIQFSYLGLFFIIRFVKIQIFFYSVYSQFLFLIQNLLAIFYKM